MQIWPALSIQNMAGTLYVENANMASTFYPKYGRRRRTRTVGRHALTLTLHLTLTLSLTLPLPITLPITLTLSLTLPLPLTRTVYRHPLDGKHAPRDAASRGEQGQGGEVQAVGRGEGGGKKKDGGKGRAKSKGIGFKVTLYERT